MAYEINDDGTIALSNRAKKNTRCKGESCLELLEDYCIIDIETTGLNPYMDDIIEIGALKIRDNKVIEVFDSLIKTDKKLGEYIVVLTGITNEMLADAPGIREVISQFLLFLGEDKVIGHNVNFDINFLYDNIKAHFEQDFNNDYIDTLSLSRRVFKEFPTHKLAYLAERLDIENKPSHRAISDCLATFDIYNKMKETAAARNIDLFKKRKTKIKAKDLIILQTEESDVSHLLYERTCVFAGTLERMLKKDAMQHIVNIGGHCAEFVTV